MERTNSYDQWINMQVVDRQGDKLGHVEEVYYDDVSGRPEWIKLDKGLFKGARLIPLAGAQMREREDDDACLVVNFDKDMIDTAPDLSGGADGHLSAEQERQLYSHYGFEWEGRGLDHHGYGKSWDANRFDTQYPKRDVGRIGNVGTDKDARIETAQVHTTAQVEVPVDAQVRLRRYETQNQRTETRTVQVPVTEIEEHVEVAGVDAKAQRPMQQQTSR